MNKEKAFQPGEYVELDEMNVIVKIPKDTVRLTMDCTILQDDSDELHTVQARLNHEDIQAARGAFLENVEDGDDYDAVYTITDKGRAWLDFIHKHPELSVEESTRLFDETWDEEVDE